MLITTNGDDDKYLEISDRRRLAKRYQVSAPVSVRWWTTQGTWHQSKGVTRDISVCGLFVVAFRVPLPGTAIEVSIEIFPPRTGMRITTLQGTGVVLRLEPEVGPAWGFAASVVFDESITRRFVDTDKMAT